MVFSWLGLMWFFSLRRPGFVVRCGFGFVFVVIWFLVSGLDGVCLGLEVLLLGVCGAVVGCLVVVILGVLGYWFGGFPVGCFLGLVLCWRFLCFSVGMTWSFWCLVGFWLCVRLFQAVVIWWVSGGLGVCFKVALGGWGYLRWCGFACCLLSWVWVSSLGAISCGLELR